MKLNIFNITSIGIYGKYFVNLRWFCGFLIILLSVTSSGCAGLFLNSETYCVLETNHYTFFYIKGSETEKEINNIAKYAEQAILWYSEYADTKVTVKPDVYLFDKGTSIGKNNILGLIDDSMMDSHSSKGVITYYYEENNYVEASVTILHETTHVIQEYLLNLRNTGIAEGHATFIGLKYYYFILGSNYDDKNIFDYLSSFVLSGLENGDGKPSDIFSMSLPEFNGVTILNGISRNPGSRYEICESFIIYLTITYGINMVNEWLRDTDTSNFKETFKKTFKTTFASVQDDWLLKVESKYYDHE